MTDNKSKTVSAKKKNLKKVLIIVIAVFAVLGVIAGVLTLILKHLEPDSETVSYGDWRFYEADYSKNIFRDELYMSLNRGIHYNRYGNEVVLTEDNIADMPVAASFFYEYFDCIIRGDYENYPSFYTEDCLNSENFNCPEMFTMQGLYDINVDLFRVTVDEASGSSMEIYEVSYRIFENNGTYRSDILPGETQTRVFEIKITDGIAKINSIGYRQIISE